MNILVAHRHSKELNWNEGSAYKVARRSSLYSTPREVPAMSNAGFEVACFGHFSLYGWSKAYRGRCLRTNGVSNWIPVDCLGQCLYRYSEVNMHVMAFFPSRAPQCHGAQSCAFVEEITWIGPREHL